MAELGDNDGLRQGERLVARARHSCRRAPDTRAVATINLLLGALLASSSLRRASSLRGVVAMAPKRSSRHFAASSDAAPKKAKAAAPKKAKASAPKKKKAATPTKAAASPKKAAASPRKAAASPRAPFEPLEPPPGWRRTWDCVRALRADRTAVVDSMGCEKLADPDASDEDRRYHTLVSLMLSSQTKDTVNAATMAKLIARGLSVSSILDDVPEDEFHEMIRGVGFHNVKTKTIRAATLKLREDHGGAVPGTMDDLLALPGVGPKMALLVLKCAFGVTAGVSVDTHVHRICNQLGWTGGAPTTDKANFATKDPEKTRRAVESWMPRAIWGDVNWLLVGLGQEVQTEKPKLLRKALAADDPAFAVGLVAALGVDVARVAAKEGLDLPE